MTAHDRTRCHCRPRAGFRPAPLIALAAAAAIGLAGCAPATVVPAPGASAGQGSSPSASSSGAEQSSLVEVRDAWVKAAEDGMSAAFGLLVNEGAEDVRVVSSTSDSSPIMELHETVENASGQMVMREKRDGFMIPAHSEYVLEPGANHLMLMDIREPVRAGGMVSFALEFEDGSVLEFEAPAKDYSGANETYVTEESGS